MIQIDEHIFQMGWNRQPVSLHLVDLYGKCIGM